MEDPSAAAAEAAAENSGPKLSSAEILASMGVDALPTKHDPLLAELEARYEAECEKARQRAQRFGVEYKAPDRAAFFEKGELKRATRMRRDEGFYVGMDLSSEEERAKIEARAAKFGGHQDVWAKRLEDEEEANKKAERAQRFGLEGERATAGLRKLSLNAERLYRPDADRLDPAELVVSGEAQVEAHKIHLFAVDKRGFQAIRSTDVLKFFDKLFPRFVEWLGPHAANVHFDDPSTAKRALEAVSQPLPSLEEVLAEHDAQLATAAGREGEGNGDGDEHQKEGDAVGMAVEGEGEGEQPAAAGAEGGEQAPGAATGEGMEGAAGAKGKRDHHRRHADLPVHGWRFAPRRLLKVKTDAYGTAGTGVRVLLRLATTADVRRPDPPQPPPPPARHEPQRSRKRGAAWGDMDEEGGFGGRGGYNSHRTVEVVPMEDGAGRRSKRRRRGGRKEKGAAGMEEDAPAGEGQEGQPGEQQEQEQQQGEQAPQQEQHYEEPVAAAPAVFENGAGMADAPVGEEGLEGFGDEDFGAAEGGDVDMFL